MGGCFRDFKLCKMFFCAINLMGKSCVWDKKNSVGKSETLWEENPLCFKSLLTQRAYQGGVSKVC